MDRAELVARETPENSHLRITCEVAQAGQVKVGRCRLHVGTTPSCLPFRARPLAGNIATFSRFDYTVAAPTFVTKLFRLEASL